MNVLHLAPEQPVFLLLDGAVPEYQAPLTQFEPNALLIQYFLFLCL
jgi:hypothetical protein